MTGFEGCRAHVADEVIQFICDPLQPFCGRAVSLAGRRLQGQADAEQPVHRRIGSQCQRLGRYRRAGPLILP